jgi:hypothetical protein
MSSIRWPAIAVVWAIWASGVNAVSVERRDYNIMVDGKRAGNYHITIQSQDDGTTTVSCRADVRVSYLVYRYTYTFRGTETWHGNQLQRLETTANDDGKQLSLSAILKGKLLHVRASGRERQITGDAWPTTYWRLPDAKFHNGSVTLLDADTGRDIKARLQFVDTTRLNIAGKPHQCRHFRVMADAMQVDLWYDNGGRLVRQETVEDGHPTVIEATSIREDQPASASKP